MIKIKYILVIFILFGLSSACVSLKTTSKTAGNLTETFYTGVDGVRYFVKPLEFRADASELVIDFTFNYLDEIKDSAIVNFSIFDEQIFKSLDSATISSGMGAYHLYEINLLFNESSKKGLKSRFTSKIKLKELIQLFGDSDWKINLKLKVRSMTFSPTRKTIKRIKRLQNSTFILF